ncbi:MAG: haloacid dehalogenase-like hydrolase [Bacteroidales bacterium]|jgi:phosphoserine phosphatase|nr:haloacid dehalogenase-like hydrolase [Bacteroidales bacterium]
MNSTCKRTIAIAYDFDGTLAPGNMQEYDFIPALNMISASFWKEANQLAKKHDMDEVLAYLFLTLKKAKEKNIPVREETFFKFGRQIPFFKGVETYFSRINQYAASKDLVIEHHIISSGIREMIKGTVIAKEFKNIFASGYQYDENGDACWPALAVNYTNKTQFLFRINKGIYNSYDNSLINKIIPENEKPVPFSNMIYIGDGETDIPAMKMATMQGGNAIAVYQSENRKNADILKNDRANYLVPADYSEGSILDLILHNIIDKIASEQNLKALGEDK